MDLKICVVLKCMAKITWNAWEINRISVESSSIIGKW